MTDISQPQPVTNHPSAKLLEPFIGLFHAVLPMAWFMSFVFAAVMTPMAVLSAFEFLPVELALIAFTILSGTYLMRYTAVKAQQEARERIRVKQIAGATVEEDELEAANAFIPSFQALLKRNLIASAFYVPLVGVISAVVYGLLTGGVIVTAEVVQVRDNAELLLRVLIPLIFVVWVFVVTRGWKVIARFVDSRLLKTEINLPENEEIRQKLRLKKMMRDLKEAEKANPQVYEIPTKSDLSLTSQDPGSNDVALSAETNLKPDRDAGMSSEMLAMRTMTRWFMGLTALVLIAGFLLTAIARSQGMNPETIKVIMIVVLGGGILTIFGVIGKVSERLTPKSAAMQRIGEWEAALRRGDYATALPLSDQMMLELPNWESKIPAAAAYAQAGQFERAEQIAREALQELSSPHTDVQRQMFKPLLGQVFSLLMEIYIMTGRLAEADEVGKHALEFDDGSNTVNNSTAKLYLLRGDANTALPYIETASKAYVKDKLLVSAYNKALRAWSVALVGDKAQSDALMVEAFQQTPSEHVTDLAELYWIGGHIAKVQKKHVASRMSFERSAKLDPNGAYAQIAERELQAL